MASESRLSTERVACVRFEGRPAGLEAFAEACLRFSPQVALRPREAVFVEVGRSRRIFSEAGLERRLAALAQRLLGVSARIAFGRSAGEALAATRYGDYARTRELGALPLAALQDFARPFGWDPDLEKRVARVVCVLESLGVRDLGGFMGLPSQGLASRLGKEAVGFRAGVEAGEVGAWPGFHPQPLITERSEVQDPEAHGLFYNLEGCVFVLRGLVDRAMARLHGRGERASVVELRFWPGQQHWRVELPVPQGSASGLIPILRDKLGYELGRVPLAGPVEAVELKVVESVPGTGPQRDFFSRKEEQSEAWDALVGRLTTKLGPDRVFVAAQRPRYLPERAYVRKLVSMPGLTKGGGDFESEPLFAVRPSRVLKKPEPLLKEGRRLMRLDGVGWKALSWEGPERLSGEWWRSEEFEGFNRDYYRVITEGGEQLWVFVNRKAATPSFYLHGFFD